MENDSQCLHFSNTCSSVKSTEQNTGTDILAKTAPPSVSSNVGNNEDLKISSVDEGDIYQMDVLTKRGTKRVRKLYNTSVQFIVQQNFNIFKVNIH